MTRYLFVFSDGDGITVCPESENGLPDSRRRVFLAGGPLDLLTELQVKALIDVSYRDPCAHEHTSKAVFLDGDRWASHDEKIELRVWHP